LETPGAAEDSQSAKGLKSGTDLVINGGNFTIDSSDDSIHSNGTILIENGDFLISTGDDGIHADTEITINGGDIVISKCYEGIESAVIIINGGNIDITSSDDGINAAGKNDDTVMHVRPGQNNFAESSKYAIYINGGNIAINASGDGIDANGSIYMTGGNVTISGPETGADSALDFDQLFEISGGTLVASGSAGMAQAPSNSSLQNSVSMIYASTQKAGTTVALKDSSGKEIISFTPNKDFQHVVISSPEIKTGEIYYYNETEFTVSAIVTSLGEPGAPTNMRQPGGFNPEGGRTRPDGTIPEGSIPEGTVPNRNTPGFVNPDMTVQPGN
jgi:hypothetical protein